jgi:hypothetical protein
VEEEIKEIVREYFEVELVKTETAIVEQDFETEWTTLQWAYILD